MGPIASSCAFSVPVMSHFAALNICQTWNILNAGLIFHAWGVRHPLICPLFFASLSKRSPLYFVDWVRWKTFLAHFWQRPCIMRSNLVLILNRVFFPSSWYSTSLPSFEEALWRLSGRKGGGGVIWNSFLWAQWGLPQRKHCFKFQCPSIKTSGFNLEF